MPDFGFLGNNTSSNFLGEMANKQLRKVETITSKPVDARSNLLTSIKSGIQLKSTQERKVVEGGANPKKEEPTNSVAAILSRRIAIQQSDSEDDDDSENDDW
jgi:hypothetical protein